MLLRHTHKHTHVFGVLRALSLFSGDRSPAGTFFACINPCKVLCLYLCVCVCVCVSTQLKELSTDKSRADLAKELAAAKQVRARRSSYLHESLPVMYAMQVYSLRCAASFPYGLYCYHAD